MEHEVSAVTRLTPRQRDWLEHLQAWERTGETLRAYAIARGLSVSGLYSARRDLIRRGAWRRERPPETTTAAPKFLPVRVTSPAPGAMFRVLLPNGTAVEVPEHADPVRTRAPPRLTRELQRLDRVECLALDDIGYVQHDRAEMEVLFAVLAERYERRSVMITSNLVFSRWDQIFKDAMTTAAAIDRVVHHSVILGLDVPSYRAEEAELRTTTRKSTKEVQTESK